MNFPSKKSEKIPVNADWFYASTLIFSDFLSISKYMKKIISKNTVFSGTYAHQKILKTSKNTFQVMLVQMAT